MKLKLVFFEMEANSAGGTESMCKALAEVLDAAFPAEPRIEVRVDDSALSGEKDGNPPG